MSFTSFLKSPKKEQQEVPEKTIFSGTKTKFVDTKINGRDYDDDDHDVVDVDIMDDLEPILGIGEEDDVDYKLTTKEKTSSCHGQLNWDVLMDWEGFRSGEDHDHDDEDEDDEAARRPEERELLGEAKCFFEEEGYDFLYSEDRSGVNGVVKREQVGFWDDEYSTRVSLNLNLNYQEVLDAWSDRGSLWADDFSMTPNGSYMGEVPVMEEERARREASVMRYKEKRQSRLFSKKIRYQVRKLNADKRPRLKGRFVKRVS